MQLALAQLGTFAWAIANAPNTDAPPISDDESRPHRPHIVIILGDDVGWANAGWHNPNTLTPRMDALVSGHAVELDPDSPRYAYVYGVGLFGDGDTERGLEVLRTAHERSPGDVELLTALAAFNRDLGRLREAIEWAGKLVAVDPSNPAYRQQLADLESLGR